MPQPQNTGKALPGASALDWMCARDPQLSLGCLRFTSYTVTALANAVMQRSQHAASN
jgi:hypothetical protein